MANYKSKRAKATDIPPEVKKAVYERDRGLCVICGMPRRTQYALYTQVAKRTWYRGKRSNRVQGMPCRV